jgi:hypothetical protein
VAEIVATPDGGFAMSVTGLVPTPTDRRTEGVFIARSPWNHRAWASLGFRAALDVVAGPPGSLGVLSVNDATGKWHFSLAGSSVGIEREVAGTMSHAALGWSGTDKFIVAHIKNDNSHELLVQVLDPRGAPRGPARSTRLPGKPSAGYHHGSIRSAARRKGGWVAAVETEDAIFTVSIDDSLARTDQGRTRTLICSRSSSCLSDRTSPCGREQTTRLSVAVHDPQGRDGTDVGAECVT